MYTQSKIDSVEFLEMAVTAIRKAQLDSVSPPLPPLPGAPCG